MFEVAGVDRINPAEHHRVNFLEAGKRFPRRVSRVRDRVADFHVGDRFDVRDEITDVACVQARLRIHLRREHTYFLDLVAPVVAHHLDRLTGFHLSRYDPHVTDDAAINIEDRIENQRSQYVVLRLFRRRNPVHDRFENFLDADPHLGACIDRFLRRDRENFFQLPMDRRHIRVRQIDLVNHRHNRQALFVREMNIRHGLRFDPLGGIDNQERAFARRERSRNFIRKIDVPRCIEQIQSIFFSRFARVTHRHRMCLDRDPALPLQVHRIEQLILLVALVNRAGRLEQSIRQRCLAVIDVRDDAKIARQLDCHGSATMRAC